MPSNERVNQTDMVQLQHDELHFNNLSKMPFVTQDRLLLAPSVGEVGELC